MVLSATNEETLIPSKVVGFFNMPLERTTPETFTAGGHYAIRNSNGARATESVQGSFGKSLRERLRRAEMMEDRKMTPVMMRHTRLIGRVKKTAKLPRENISADLK